MTYELEIKPLQGNVSPDALLGLARLMIAESRFARLGVDETRLHFHIVDILTQPQSLAFGAFDLGVLCGMAIGVCGTILPFTSAVVATEHYLFLTPAYRGGREAGKLVHAFIQEARARGAQDVVLSNGYGGDPDKVGKLFERCGLTRIGGIYSLGE